MSTYIIGEIGQNHNGSIEIAKAIIDIAAVKPEDRSFNTDLKPLDAVKLTKRDLNEELSDSQMKRPYTGRNSFGSTYGEHRAYLELSDEEHYELYKHTKGHGLDFVETLCSIGCLSLFKLFTPDRLKVASRDLTNLPLLNAMAETMVPIILSTGMGGKQELDEALEIITKHHSEITILHCLSQYPAEYQNINLNSIKALQQQYSSYTIGYSDHSIGISIPLAAVALGAQVIEKHITLDRRMRGSDQYGSLGIDGLNRMVRDIRNLELAFGSTAIFKSEASHEAMEKLQRSIATKRAMKKGEVIYENDVHLLSPGDGYQWRDRNEVFGRRLVNDIPQNEIIYPSMINE